MVDGGAIDRRLLLVARRFLARDLRRLALALLALMAARAERGFGERKELGSE